MQTLHFGVDEPSVIHECVDGEVLIVNLRQGAYFSLVGAAAEIWNALAAGASTDELVATLVARFDAPAETLTTAVSSFVGELLREQLVVARSNATATFVVPTWDAAKEPFEAPLLSRYTDIEEHMKVDPVHEVDDAGWPPPPGAR